jgi:hypothetical protein
MKIYTWWIIRGGGIYVVAAYTWWNIRGGGIYVVVAYTWWNICVVEYT